MGMRTEDAIYRVETMRVKHIASISFGKDSLAMLAKIKENGMPLDSVVYVEPMFDENTSAEYPEMVDFIQKAEERLLYMYGVKVDHIRSDKTFCEVFYQVKVKGKHVGTIYGFPMTSWSWCNDRLKQRAFRQYFKEAGEHVRYIGLAADETRRLKRLADNARAPLAELGITESQAMSICRERGLLSPLYDDERIKRIGCWFCPKQNIKSLAWMKRMHPDLWAKMLEMQDESPVLFKPNESLFDIDGKLDKGIEA